MKGWFLRWSNKKDENTSTWANHRNFKHLKDFTTHQLSHHSTEPIFQRRKTQTLLTKYSKLSKWATKRTITIHLQQNPNQTYPSKSIIQTFKKDAMRTANSFSTKRKLTKKIKEFRRDKSRSDNRLGQGQNSHYPSVSPDKRSSGNANVVTSKRSNPKREWNFRGRDRRKDHTLHRPHIQLRKSLSLIMSLSSLTFCSNLINSFSLINEIVIFPIFHFCSCLFIFYQKIFILLIKVHSIFKQK